MKKICLTLLATLACVTINAQTLSTISHFYGPGYYRIVNGASGNPMRVISNVLNGTNSMDDIDLSPAAAHALHSDAGSIMQVAFLDEADLDAALPYGLFNIGAQGINTHDITASLMPLINGMFEGRTGMSFPLEYIPVNFNVARTAGELEAVAPLQGQQLYQAGFNLMSIAAMFRDFHGESGFYFDHFGFTMDMTRSIDLGTIANSIKGLVGEYDEYCNWLIVPVESTTNYYTPAYNNAATVDASTAYVTQDGVNWATVYVDFPFYLPEGATAHYLDGNTEQTVALDWEFIPARTPVMISWPGDGSNDVHLRPGLLPAATEQALSATLDAKLSIWREKNFDEVIALMTEDYDAACTAYGEAVVKKVAAVALATAAGMGEGVLQSIGLSESSSAAEVMAAIKQLNDVSDAIARYDAIMAKDEAERTTEEVQFAAYFEQQGLNNYRGVQQMVPVVNQMLVTATRNYYFYTAYQSVFAETVAEYQALADQYTAEMTGLNNKLFSCGDFFAYEEGHSAAAAAGETRAIDTDDKQLGSDAGFSQAVTRWHGNMAYANTSSHTLQWIVNDGTLNTPYTVSDRLQVMFVFSPDDNQYVIYAKDNDNYRDKDVMPDGLKDYMKLNYFNSWNYDLNTYNLYARTSGYDQSNWVKISGADGALPKPLKDLADKLELGPEQFVVDAEQVYYINHARLRLSDRDAVEAEWVSGEFETSTDTKTMYEAFNTYIPAHFHSSNTQKGFFFNRPKVNEVALFNWGVYDAGRMLMPKKAHNPDTGADYNSYDLKGGYAVDMELVDLADMGDLDFEQGESYEYFGIVGKKAQSSQPAARRIEGDDSSVSDEFVVYPIYSTSYAPRVVTAVNRVDASKRVTAVAYVDLAGRRALQPWPGVNLVVTRYSDGTQSTEKVIR